VRPALLGAVLRRSRPWLARQRRLGQLGLRLIRAAIGTILNAEILETMALLDDAQEIDNLLVALANEAGGHDNITALVLKT